MIFNFLSNSNHSVSLWSPQGVPACSWQGVGSHIPRPQCRAWGSHTLNCESSSSVALVDTSFSRVSARRRISSMSISWQPGRRRDKVGSKRLWEQTRVLIWAKWSANICRVSSQRAGMNYLMWYKEVQIRWQNRSKGPSWTVGKISRQWDVWTVGCVPWGEALLLGPLRELVKTLHAKLSSNVALRQERATCSLHCAGSCLTQNHQKRMLSKCSEEAGRGALSRLCCH